MAKFVDTPVIPSLIANTEMTLTTVDGRPSTYNITPASGYVLHDKAYDYPVIDRDTLEETGEVVLGYRTSTASCSANYDFEANPREFYAVTATPKQHKE